MKTVSKLQLFEKKGLIGCLNQSGITSTNYKEILKMNDDLNITTSSNKLFLYGKEFNSLEEAEEYHLHWLNEHPSDEDIACHCQELNLNLSTNFAMRRKVLSNRDIRIFLDKIFIEMIDFLKTCQKEQERKDG